MSEEDMNMMHGSHLPDIVNTTQGNSAGTRKRRWNLALAGMDDPPKAFDWRNVNGVSYVTPARYQRQVMTCYAFAAVSNTLINYAN